MISIVLRENKTLHEIFAGIIAVGLAIGIICFLVAKNPVYCIIGLGLGMAGSIFMAAHMAVSIEDMVLLNEKDAASYSRKMTLIRYGVVCALVAIVGVTDIGHPALCVVGLLLLKAGAYMQPLMHRILNKKELNDFTEIENEVIMEKIPSQGDKVTDKNQNTTQLGGE